MRLLVVFTAGLIGGPVLAECAMPKRHVAAALGGSVADCGSEPGVCRWTFQLGDAASRETYEALRVGIRACGEPMSAIRDQGVNHPDFYDAWVYRFDDGGLSLSIKDKAALGETYVVLRHLPKI